MSKKSSKCWIETEDDVDAMYEAYNVDDTINIWCDGKSNATVERQVIKKATADDKARCADDEPLSKRARKEKNIEQVFQTLLEKHRDPEYFHVSDPQYIYGHACM